MKLANKTILVCVSGGIAAYKACDLIRILQKEKARVKCLMTENAKHFITPLTLEALSGNRVYSEMFELRTFDDPLHTHLADEANLVLVCPASANVIARMAHGLANDLVTTVYLATKAPVMVVPAMNDRMWKHPATQANLALLKKRGVAIVSPIEGKLVCGRTEVGHIASQDEILAAIHRLK